jgi:hypothetical protein
LRRARDSQRDSRAPSRPVRGSDPLVTADVRGSPPQPELRDRGVELESSIGVTSLWPFTRLPPAASRLEPACAFRSSSSRWSRSSPSSSVRSRPNRTSIYAELEKREYGTRA